MVLAGVACAQEGPKKITSAEAMKAVATKVQPEYPAMAMQLKIQGKVEVDAEVGENGVVEKVTVVSGNAILTASAARAVKLWKFRPFLEDGKPVRVIAPIVLDFHM